MKKHILFLAWKDTKHPNAWWAEVVMCEYAKRLVWDWHKVTWFASNFSGWTENEIIDGIQVIRKYSINTIYFFAWKWYKNFKKANTIDLIIDEAGGIPLLSPLYEKKIPIYFFIHHIGEHEYETAFFFPLNKIFKKFVYWTFSLYKKYPTITVSNSTKEELQNKFAFENIRVVENATYMKPIEKIDFTNKKKEIVFLARLTQMKRPDHAIKAFNELYKKDKEYVLNIIWNEQDKDYVKSLKELLKDLKLENNVNFLWYSEKIVEKYLQRAKAMLVTSTKEWYGLIVLEWNCYWLPVLAYDVNWLRDSVREWKNWFLIKNGYFREMWERLVKLLEDKESLEDISQKSLDFIKKFWWWNERYEELKKIIFK